MYADNPRRYAPILAAGHTGGVRQAIPDTEATAAPAPVQSRLRGIDMARGIAIIGMVMVHIGPQDLQDSGLIGAAYRSSHGRAAILFIVLAGVGVSLLTGSGRGRAPASRWAGMGVDLPRRRGAATRLWWRALILLPFGLGLQELPTNVAVILQYYAVFFVIASGLMYLGDRVLIAIAACSATLGPIALVWLHQASPTWFLPGVPAWNDAGRIVRDILVSGYYPAIVWTAPLAIGIWLGRRDLRDTAIAGRLVAGGAAAAAVGFVLSDVLVGVLGPAASESDWRQLIMIEPHNEMPLWVLTSTGIATAIVGACLLIARRVPRLVWPMVAFGQLAFTVYVLHVLVLAFQPEWFVRDQFVPAWLSVARFGVISAALATAYRAVAQRGPFELLLRAPWPQAAKR
jgi:uncharacterized membrane protein